MKFFCTLTFFDPLFPSFHRKLLKKNMINSQNLGSGNKSAMRCKGARSAPNFFAGFARKRRFDIKCLYTLGRAKRALFFFCGLRPQKTVGDVKLCTVFDPLFPSFHRKPSKKNMINSQKLGSGSKNGNKKNRKKHKRAHLLLINT